MHPVAYALPVLAYLYGAVPFGFLAAKLIKGVDIRQTGSGNIGATNAARVIGWKSFPVIFLLDFSKGFLPTLAALLLTRGASGYHPHPLAILTGVAAIIGHVFPLYLRFRGGKAVATGTGAFAALAPWQVLIAFGVWAAVFAIWRYVSLASMSAAAALAVAVWLLHGDPLGSGVFLTVFATLGAAFIIQRHRGNIRRLIAGTEHKVGRRRPPSARAGGEDGNLAHPRSGTRPQD